MTPTRTARSGLLAALLAASVLTGCTSDAGDPAAAPGRASVPGAPAASTPPSASATTPPTTPSGTPSARPSSPPAVAVPPAAVGVPAFRSDLRGVTATPTGGPLTVVAARAAAQPGYDRVVLQLAGKAAGRPGWTVEYVDEAVQDGSGRPVEVNGSAVLRVVVTGVGYPFDTGQTEATADLTPKDTAVVREVDLQATYEGSFTAFVGLSRTAPFRVFRLADPARVVVDVRTG